MAGLSDYSAQNVLNYLSGQLIVPALPSVFCALYTTAPTSDVGTGGTEVSGGAYARIQVAGNLTAQSAASSTITFASVPAWVVAGMSVRDVTTPGNVPASTTIVSTTPTTVVCNNSVAGVGTDVIRFSAWTPAAASTGNPEPFTLPASDVNTGAVISFPQSTLSWGTATSWGLYDAVTSGNLLWWDYLGNFKWLPFSVTLASPGVLTAPAHGYSNGDSVVVTQKFDGTLPVAFTGAILTVANSTTDTFTAGINTATTGNGQVRKITQQSIPSNVTASFAANTFTLSLA
jgi:hypothetical protein